MGANDYVQGLRRGLEIAREEFESDCCYDGHPGRCPSPDWSYAEAQIEKEVREALGQLPKPEADKGGAL